MSKNLTTHATVREVHRDGSVIPLGSISEAGPVTVSLPLTREQSVGGRRGRQDAMENGVSVGRSGPFQFNVTMRAMRAMQ